MSFQDAAFLSANFSAEAFVTEQRKSLTLDLLRAELEQYVAGLDTALVSVINNDYSAFLRLSAMLVDIDVLVEGLREPLSLLEGRVAAVRGAAAGPLSKQQQLLDRLLYVQEKKRVLRLCHSARETLETVERQVEQLKGLTGSAGGGGPGQGQKGPAEQSDEVASEAGGRGGLVSAGARPGDVEIGEALGRASQRLARVSFLSHENSGLPLLRAIRAKARGLEHALLEQLNAAFVKAADALAADVSGEAAAATKTSATPAALASASAAMCVVLRAYAAIGAREAAGQAFHKVVARPFLEALLSPARVDAGGERGAASGLGAVFRQVVAFAVERCLPVQRAAEACVDEPGLLGELDLIGGALCDAVREGVRDKLQSAYSSGAPDTLVRSYRCTAALFKVLAKLATKPGHVEAAAEETLALWDLTVYVQLRGQEQAAALERALAQPQAHALAQPRRDANGLVLPGSRELCRAGALLLSPDVFLHRAGPRLLRTLLELVGRLTKWAGAIAATAKRGLPARAPAPAAGAAPGEQPPAEAAELAKSPGPVAPVHVPAPVPVDEAAKLAVGEMLSSSSAQGDEAAQQTALSALLVVASDCQALEGWLRSLTPIISGLLFPSPPPHSEQSSASAWQQGRQAASSALTHVAAQLASLSADCRAAVRAAVAEKCAAQVVRAAEAVPPMYRMTNKPPPTKASALATAALDPLAALLAQPAAAELLHGAPARAEAEAVLEAVLAALLRAARAELTKIVASENALKRLNRAAAGSRRLDSSSDKIKEQYRLDLEDLLVRAKERFGAACDEWAVASELRSDFAPAPAQPALAE